MENIDYLLVDGTNLIFRSFYGIKPLTNAEGFPVNAIYGFIKTLWNLEERMHPQHYLIFMDCSRSKRRKEILPDYKANRAPTPEDLKKQILCVKEIIPLLGYTLLEQMDIEADDLLGTWAHHVTQNQKHACIVSADKDLMQCVNPYVHLWIPGSFQGGWNVIDEEGVFKKMGVYPHQIVDYLALIGDSADNFAGIYGVGPKTAAQWLNRYQSINGIFDNLNILQPKRFRAILQESRPLLERNQQLAQLEISNQWIQPIQPQSVDQNTLRNHLIKLGLNSLANKIPQPTQQPASQQIELF